MTSNEMNGKYMLLNEIESFRNLEKKQHLNALIIIVIDFKDKTFLEFSKFKAKLKQYIIYRNLLDVRSFNSNLN